MRALYASFALLLCACHVTVIDDHCSDGLLNGNETDIDCGGPTCGSCLDGETCVRASDCASGVCDVDLRCGLAQVSALPSTAGAPVYMVDPGAGIIVTPGTQSGYGITANAGGVFRVVWTGDAVASGAYRNFTGQIWVAGTFDSFTPGCAASACPLESGDTVSPPVSVTGGQVITFDTVATDGLDGVDFSVTAQPVYFDLQIDGKSYPQLVFFTSKGVQSNTASMPFGLATH
jgi:hypothetical protein